MSGADLLRAPRCTAHSKQTKQRCGRSAIPGGTVCRYHGGLAPQVQEAAMARLRKLQHPAIDALAWLIGQKDFPSAAFSAARDVLDRTEGKAAETIAMTVNGDEAQIAALHRGRQRALEGR